ncbi:unnamed protein product [Ectocarpus sp. 12 AP-2014]
MPTSLPASFVQKVFAKSYHHHPHVDFLPRPSCVRTRPVFFSRARNNSTTAGLCPFVYSTKLSKNNMQYAYPLCMVDVKTSLAGKSKPPGNNATLIRTVDAPRNRSRIRVGKTT